MATLSQRLHSFALPHLKWETTQPRSALLHCHRPPVSSTTPDTEPAFSAPVTQHNESADEPNRNQELLAEKKGQKRKTLSVSLTKEEIEKDFMEVVAHLKPKRRVKKRPTKVQKTLDLLFPGLHLGSITEESYRTRSAG